MGRLAWIVTLPALVVAVVFALANRQSANVRLWPLKLELELPVFLLVLGGLGLGLFIGGLVGWMSVGRARQRAHLANLRASRLEAEVEKLRRQPPSPAEKPAPRLVS